MLSYNITAVVRIYACASTRLFMTLPHFRPPVPLPATASAEGRQFNGGPFPASVTAEGAQVNVPPFPATASEQGRGNFPSVSIRTHIPVIQQALAAAKEAARQAGKVILSYYSSHY